MFVVGATAIPYSASVSQDALSATSTEVDEEVGVQTFQYKDCIDAGRKPL